MWRGDGKGEKRLGTGEAKFVGFTDQQILFITTWKAARKGVRVGETHLQAVC